MNFLAHLYLSGNDAELKIGNFIADHIKGKAINELSTGIKNGVLLHRKIDFFTDQHAVVLQSKVRLRNEFGKFAPVIADVFYDHFLAVNWNNYNSISLQKFAQDFYSLTQTYINYFPEKTRQMLPYMISNNWLVGYASVEGINRTLTGMARRTPFDSGMEKAALELENNYLLYEQEFTRFFGDLERYVANEIAVIPTL